jgi:hypothetical protein
MTKAELKRKLAKMPPAKRKRYIEKLKEKQKLQRSAKKKTTGPNEEESLPEVLPASDVLQKIVNGEPIGSESVEDQRRLKRGITLLELWKGVQALANVVDVQRLLLTRMYNAGVTRRPEIIEPVPGGAEIKTVDPRKLHKFVKTVPGLWDKWNCETAVCWQCPWHRGKGVVEQNRQCANESLKEAMKHNSKCELVKQMPFTKAALNKLPRNRLVQILGVLGVSVFKMKDGSKKGIVSYLTPALQRRRLKGKKTHYSKPVAIPDSLFKDVKQ